MAHSRRFYENLPVYAQYVDEVGTLAHFADRVAQPLFDTFERKLALLELIYNPDTCPDEYLDFLGQYIGAGLIGNRWVGLGMNPSWSANRKRSFILNFWKFRNSRGTEGGTREGVELWLGWEGARDAARFPIVLPAGRLITDDPPLLWSYLDPYESDLNLAVEESPHWGTLDAVGDRYNPAYFSLVNQAEWDYENLWWDGEVEQQFSPELIDTLSSLGHHCPWMHLHVKASEWNELFPNIHVLNQEILSVRARPEVFAWLIPDNAIAPFLLEEAEVVREERTIVQYFLDGLKWGSIENLDAIATVDPDLAYHYTADLWPAVFNDGIKETKIVTKEVEFGVWLPEEWEYQLWGETVTSAYQIGQPTLEITLDLGGGETIDLSSLTPIETLEIDLEELVAYDASWTFLYYAPWDNWVVSSEEVVVSAANSCDLGASFTVVDFSPQEYQALELPLEIPGETNQYYTLAIADDNTESVLLTEPITIAEFDSAIYEEQYSYFFNDPPIPTSIFSLPIETLEIDLRELAPIDLNSEMISPLGRASARACNVPDFWTTLTAERYETYVQDDEAEGGQRSLPQIYPQLNVVLEAGNWNLLVTASNEIYVLDVATSFWFKGNPAEVLPANIPFAARSQSFSPEDGYVNLYLEYIFQPKSTALLYSASLVLKNGDSSISISYQDFADPLKAGERGYCGFTFVVPFEVESTMPTATLPVFAASG